MKEHVPNAVSGGRVVCAVMALLCARRRKWRPALGWFVLGAVTDNIDGWLARRFKAVTALGSDYLEPVGDVLLVKLTELGLILGKEYTWSRFLGLAGAGGIILAPWLVLPKDHTLALRSDTAIGFVYVGELLWCTCKLARLAEAKTFLRWAPLSAPFIAWACRHTIKRWISQLA